MTLPETPGPPRARSRFRREALNARARWRLAGGLLLLVLSLAYGGWATRRLGTPGLEGSAVDRPVIRVAARMVAPLRVRLEGEPRTDDEFYLRAVVRDQQDVVFGLTVLVLRLVLASTVGGLGLVLLTAGSTEWEVRSERSATPLAQQPAA